jgi:hypothetical protein
MSELLREKEKRQKEIKREREKVTFVLLGSGFVLVARHGSVWIRKRGSHKRRRARTEVARGASGAKGRVPRLSWCSCFLGRFWNCAHARERHPRVRGTKILKVSVA